MKKIYVLLMSCLMMITCNKDVEPYNMKTEIKVSEIGSTAAKVEAMSEEAGFDELDAVLEYSSNEDFSDLKQTEMKWDEDCFMAVASQLEVNTKYYYKVVFKGKYNSTETEVGSFTTLEGHLPTITTKDISHLTSNSAISGGNVTDDGGEAITARGVCWSTKQNPTINDNKTIDGNGTGNYISYITNLSENTQYYVRAYATNEKGTSYGAQKSFTTLECYELTVTTSDVTNIGGTIATSGGNVTSDGNATVTARGVCWSEVQNPTIDNIYCEETNDGSGTGTFTSYLTNLKPNTTYYVRAYAKNNEGTAYGAQKSFTTLEFKNETFTVNGVSFTMIAVRAGTFQMGATSEQGSGADDNEKPVHSVTLSDYYIGETEVTQELWEAVMGSNPSNYDGYPQRPVEKVSWNDCQEFITKLNNLTGKNFRLPTEAEWEYAARGGNKSQGYKYSGCNTINDVAWYTDNSSSTNDVKTKQANELGIYDMSGNVCEWCYDWYGSYSSGSQTNPTGPSSGSYRVLRGGSWRSSAWSCRVSLRIFTAPGDRYYSSGIRLSLSQ